VTDETIGGISRSIFLKCIPYPRVYRTQWQFLLKSRAIFMMILKVKHILGLVKEKRKTHCCFVAIYILMQYIFGSNYNETEQKRYSYAL